MATATSADAVQALLQVGEQPLGLLARAGRMLLVTAQVGAFGFEGRTDTLVDGALALAQSLLPAIHRFDPAVHLPQPKAAASDDREARHAQ